MNPIVSVSTWFVNLNAWFQLPLIAVISYLLGSIYDGMYLEKMEEELGSVDEILADGRIGEITKWLNEKIHWYGSTRTPKEVIAAVCGKEVSAQPLVRYMKKKYTRLYGFSEEA